MMHTLGQIDGWLISKLIINGKESLVFSHSDHEKVFTLESPNVWLNKIDESIDNRLLELGISGQEYMEE